MCLNVCFPCRREPVDDLRAFSFISTLSNNSSRRNIAHNIIRVTQYKSFFTENSFDLDSIVDYELSSQRHNWLITKLPDLNRVWIGVLKFTTLLKYPYQTFCPSMMISGSLITYFYKLFMIWKVLQP